MKRIVCMGGGPAGLYSAILLKKHLPRARIEVHERNRPDDTFGWGVVFSDKTMANFADADPESHAAIVDSFYHWDDIDVHIHGQMIRSGGHGFSGIERKRLLNILQERAAALGVEQTFQHEVRDEADFADADLLIASDGVNSRTRVRHAAALQPSVDVRKCRFIWLGTTQKFPAFTFAFERTEHGWFQIHAYQFSKELSTVIVETREETWLAHGLDRANTDESVEFCESLFGKYLRGAPLMSNARHLRGSAWLNFNRVLCRRWFTDNIVLIGDAAHTAHFSIGSGTKLAMEDAIALSREIARGGEVGDSLQRYQEERELEALKLQSAARNRMEWFENVARYTHLEPLQFTYSLLTGSQRIGHENLKLRDAEFVRKVEDRLAERAGTHVKGPPPMFLPFRLRDLQLVNRVVVSPMAQYCAREGVPDDWHLVHLGSRATGGAGLVFTEMTCVSPPGRITPGCTGLWNEQQREAWRRIVLFVHAHSQAKICLQLGHSGRKGSTQLGWEKMDYPLPAGNWPLISASPLPYLEGVSQVPAEASEQDIEEITGQFVTAARLGIDAGFDMIELHMAHGYLLASFLSPLTNRRTDLFGGALENRVRFPVRRRARRSRAHARGYAALSANLRERLGARWPDRSRSARRRTRAARRRRRRHRRLERSDGALAEASVRAHVSDAVLRSDPQHARRADNRGREHLRSRSRELDRGIGSRRSVRHCAAAPCEPIVDAAGRRRAAVRRAVVAAAVSLGQESARAESATRRVACGDGMSASLNGEHALVTGASRGIGAAIARTLAERGARVSLLGRDRAALERTAAACGGETCTAVADVTNPESIRAAFHDCRERVGHITILVNNAGQARSAPLATAPDGLWEDMLSVNLTGAYHCIRAALPDMLQAGRGRIVNIASTAGLIGYPYVTAYCAAKHGVIGLTRALALELARRNVTVNAVCPGYTDTDMVQEAIANIRAKTGRAEAEATAALTSRNPQGRLIRPQEVAEAVAWLCTRSADSVTGQSIAVAGGEVM